MIRALWAAWHRAHGTLELKGPPHARYDRCSACGAAQLRPQPCQARQCRGITPHSWVRHLTGWARA